jgi:pimeloyl-ACP methyl ester carboxylesterase
LTFASAPDGVRVRIHHLGGTGPPLLCVHATGFHGRVWEPFVPQLRERFTAVSLDQRGHGDSDKPESGYDWHKFGDDVLAVVDELSLERPVAIGHSAGAAALIFAETTRPGTFERLVLMDPVTPQPDIGAFMASDDNPMSAQARRRRAVWDSTDQMIERLKKDGSPLAGWREEFLRAYVTYGTQAREDGQVELKCPPEVEAQIYTMGGRHDGWQRMEQVSCPTLLLVGEASVMWDSERTRIAGERLVNGRAQTVPGGHFFPMEQPETAIEATLAFLLGAEVG